MESNQPEEMSWQEVWILLDSLRAKNIEYKEIETNLEDKITNTVSVFHNLSVAKELSPMKEEINQTKKELLDSNLMKILSEIQYEFMPERLIDIKKMVKGIDEWFKNLRCNHKGCEKQASNKLNVILIYLQYISWYVERV